MKELNYPETKKYVIDHNGEDQFTLTPVNTEDTFSTEMEFMEVFDTLDEAKKRYIELAGDNKFLDKIS